MGKTYYDCPCCEREVWVHSFWGAAFVGAVCNSCRDDHGNYTTSSCSVNGPAKRRRDQRKRDAAMEQARRDRDAYEIERKRRKEKREKEEAKRIQDEIKKKQQLRKKQEEEMRLRRVAEQTQRDHMKTLLAKQIADKEAAAKQIRAMKKKNNPFKHFKTMKTHQFIQDIAERVEKVGAAGEILEEQIDNIKAELKQSLGDEFSVVQSEFVHYQTYANNMKSLSSTFIEQFGQVFDEVKQQEEDIKDCTDEVFHEKDDSYRTIMGENINKLSDAADEMAGQLAVMDAYYDKMISDGRYFEQFVQRLGDEQDEDSKKDTIIRKIVKDFKETCKDDRQYDSGMYKTKFSVDYECKTYKRNANSVWDNMKYTVSDNTRKACSAIADAAVVTGVAVGSTAAIGAGGAAIIGTGGVALVPGASAIDAGLKGYDYLSTRKSLYGSCIKKIENEKYSTTTETVTCELKQEFYDGKKHKQVLEKFTEDVLFELKKPLKEQIGKYNDMAEAAKIKNNELEDFRKKGLIEMQTYVEKFRKDARELKNKLNSSVPLREMDCKLLSDNWTSLKVQIGSLLGVMKQQKDKMKDVKVEK